MISANRGLFSLPISALKDRPIYLAFYDENASEEAATTFTDVAEATKEKVGNHEAKRLDYFENADHYPLNASIVSIYCGRRGAIRVEGPYRRVPELDRRMKVARRKKSTLNIVIKETEVLGMPFDLATRNMLTERILANKDEIFQRAEEQDWVISLYSALTNDG